MTQGSGRPIGSTRSTPTTGAPQPDDFLRAPAIPASVHDVRVPLLANPDVERTLPPAAIVQSATGTLGRTLALNLALACSRLVCYVHPAGMALPRDLLRCHPPVLKARTPRHAMELLAGLTAQTTGCGPADGTPATPSQPSAPKQARGGRSGASLRRAPAMEAPGVAVPAADSAPAAAAVSRPMILVVSVEGDAALREVLERLLDAGTGGPDHQLLAGSVLLSFSPVSEATVEYAAAKCRSRKMSYVQVAVEYEVDSEVDANDASDAHAYLETATHRILDSATSSNTRMWFWVATSSPECLGDCEPVLSCLAKGTTVVGTQPSQACTVRMAQLVHFEQRRVRELDHEHRVLRLAQLNTEEAHHDTTLERNALHEKVRTLEEQLKVAYKANTRASLTLGAGNVAGALSPEASPRVSPSDGQDHLRQQLQEAEAKLQDERQKAVTMAQHALQARQELERQVAQEQESAVRAMQEMAELQRTFQRSLQDMSGGAGEARELLMQEVERARQAAAEARMEAHQEKQAASQLRGSWEQERVAYKRDLLSARLQLEAAEAHARQAAEETSAAKANEQLLIEDMKEALDMREEIGADAVRLGTEVEVQTLAREAVEAERNSLRTDLEARVEELAGEARATARAQVQQMTAMCDQENEAALEAEHHAQHLQHLLDAEKKDKTEMVEACTRRIEAEIKKHGLLEETLATLKAQGVEERKRRVEEQAAITTKMRAEVAAAQTEAQREMEVAQEARGAARLEEAGALSEMEGSVEVLGREVEKVRNDLEEARRAAEAEAAVRKVVEETLQEAREELKAERWRCWEELEEARSATKRDRSTFDEMRAELVAAKQELRHKKASSKGAGEGRQPQAQQCVEGKEELEEAACILQKELEEERQRRQAAVEMQVKMQVLVEEASSELECLRHDKLEEQSSAPLELAEARAAHQEALREVELVAASEVEAWKQEQAVEQGADHLQRDLDDLNGRLEEAVRAREASAAEVQAAGEQLEAERLARMEAVAASARMTAALQAAASTGVHSDEVAEAQLAAELAREELELERRARAGEVAALQQEVELERGRAEEAVAAARVRGQIETDEVAEDEAIGDREKVEDDIEEERCGTQTRETEAEAVRGELEVEDSERQQVQAEVEKLREELEEGKLVRAEMKALLSAAAYQVDGLEDAVADSLAAKEAAEEAAEALRAELGRERRGAQDGRDGEERGTQISLSASANLSCGALIAAPNSEAMQAEPAGALPPARGSPPGDAAEEIRRLRTELQQEAKERREAQKRCSMLELAANDAAHSTELEEMRTQLQACSRHHCSGHQLRPYAAHHGMLVAAVPRTHCR
ncbi:hypothetical protein CYMTET_19918 [Cymbomonas tetramitiformis]|uniref:Uncharacterized protein n=1 Tax=Cymbomonas tetramitiformis TaxID=36881 RepID=A0AAE0G5Q6_9CHLO|nr:hypothetical protein CYMTET_19918 [Cymbomonas tetramitiformis]